MHGDGDGLILVVAAAATAPPPSPPQVTPVAELAPVAVQGVTIGRATLHNVGMVEAMDLRPGDSVVLERAGDVIPKVGRAAARRPHVRAV